MMKKHKVLVVEDDDTCWTVLEWALKTIPCEVERAIGGKTALDLVQKGGYDAIVLDLMIPEMPGQDVLKALDSNPRFKGFPILINSSVADSSWIKNELTAFRNLKIDSLPRPADHVEIVESMQKLLGLPVGAPASSPAAPKKKVLIVDDDSGVRAMYLPYFAVRGYEAKAAGDGRQAIQILEKESVDLIILDLAMPGMTGEDVMQAIADRPSWRNIPIIVDTALGPTAEQVQRIKQKFTDKLRFEFFQRPTSLEELNEAIHRILIF